MAGSLLLASALLHAWMCPFNDPPTVKGDHHLLGLDFDPEIHFGTKTTGIVATGQRGAKSRQAQTVTKYCKRVITQCNWHQLDECIAHLLNVSHFAQEHYQELEAIDTQLTQILTKADHQCRPKTNAPWSPDLNQAYLQHQFWSIKFSAKCNHKDMKDMLKALRDRIHPTPEDHLESTRTLSANLHHAQKALRKQKQEVDLL